MDKQADPVAELAGDAASGAPEADATDRQRSLGRGDSGQERTVSAAEPRREAPAPAPAPEPSVFAPRPKPSGGPGSPPEPAKRPSFLKGPRKRSDATVPIDLARQAGVQKATGGLRPAEDDKPDLADVPADQDAASGNGASDTEATLAAAALARELTGAGFATPGFALSARPDTARPDTARRDTARPDQAGSGRAGSDEGEPAHVDEAETRSDARPSSSPSGTVPPAGTPASSAAVTNPAWASPARPADRPASPNWTSPAPGPAAPLGSGYAQSPNPATSPAARYSAGAAGGAAAADQAATAYRASPASAPPSGSAYAPPVPSEKQKLRFGNPFARAGKKLRPNAGARPGGANSDGNAPMSVKSSPGVSRRPAAEVAPRSRPEPTEVRDAQLVISRVEPWSVTKFTFMISLLGFIVLFIVVAVIYYALSTLGLFHSIEQTVGLVTSSKGNPGTNAASWFSAGTVLRYTAIAGGVDVFLITALSTVGAVMYNAISRLTGGVEVTLAEAD